MRPVHNRADNPHPCASIVRVAMDNVSSAVSKHAQIPIRGSCIQFQGQHFCGCSLLRVGAAEETDIVVTAARCCDELSGIGGLTANAGAHNLEVPAKTQQTVAFAKYVLHPQYDSITLVNDIALVKLAKPIKFTSAAVQPICLSAADEKAADGTEGTVTGWGLTEEKATAVSNLLMQVGVPIMNGEKCILTLAKSNTVFDPASMICTGHEQGGEDSCKGDSGGPFVIKGGETSSYVLHGVVSQGIGCARAGQPGVYTRVAHFPSWLNEQMKALSTVAE